MSDIAIRVENVSKKFATRMRYVMMYGALDIAASFFGVNLKTDQLRKGEFFAVNDVSFEVKKGEAVGLIGANGAGKSTMLKMLNGIYMPDKGHIEMHGRVGALIEVGAGFHPMLTGRENIYINGSILGLKKKELDKKLDSIIDFSGIEEFIDMPVKNYSSGMYVRLGFAIAAHCNPDILIVDEVLAVGDAKFRRKCLDHLLGLQKQGTTFILVSHNMATIEGICTDAIFFNKGKNVYSGNSTVAISYYEKQQLLGQDVEEQAYSLSSNSSLMKGSLKLIKHLPEYGTHDVDVQAIYLLDKDNTPQTSFFSNEKVFLKVEVKSNVDRQVILRVYFRDDQGVTCLGTHKNAHLEKGEQEIYLTFDPVMLTTGRYLLVFHIYDETFTLPYSNGHYGYFEVNSKTVIESRGKISPYCWIDPPLQIK